MTNQLFGSIRRKTKDQFRDKIMSYLERFNIDSIVPCEVFFLVINGSTCRKCDSGNKAERPKKPRKT